MFYSVCSRAYLTRFHLTQSVQRLLGDGLTIEPLVQFAGYPLAYWGCAHNSTCVRECRQSTCDSQQLNSLKSAFSRRIKLQSWNSFSGFGTFSAQQLLQIIKFSLQFRRINYRLSAFKNLGLNEEISSEFQFLTIGRVEKSNLRRRAEFGGD